MQRIELGREGESLGATYLERHGWRIVDRNVRFREGEIDLIAERAGVLAIVEVKTRRSRAFGTPAEAVTYAKQKKIRIAAARWLMERRPGSDTIRFDVLDILHSGGTYRITHLEGAF